MIGSEIMKFVFVFSIYLLNFRSKLNMEWLYIPMYQKRASYPLVLGFFILYGCSYRSVTMSHTVYTTSISSVDFKLGQNTSSRADRYSIIYVPVDLAITIAQSQRHQSVFSCEIQTRKSNVFFVKIVVAIVMFKSSPN